MKTLVIVFITFLTLNTLTFAQRRPGYGWNYGVGLFDEEENQEAVRSRRKKHSVIDPLIDALPTEELGLQVSEASLQMQASYLMLSYLLFGEGSSDQRRRVKAILKDKFVLTELSEQLGEVGSEDGDDRWMYQGLYEHYFSYQSEFSYIDFLYTTYIIEKSAFTHSMTLEEVIEFIGRALPGTDHLALRISYIQFAESLYEISSN